MIGAKRWLIHDSVSYGSSLSERLSARSGRRENLYSEYHKYVEQAILRETKASLSREVPVCIRVVVGSEGRDGPWRVSDRFPAYATAA